MRYLGLDLGTKRLGIAISDRSGLIASPYEVLTYKDASETLPRIKNIIENEKVSEIALGLPKNMDGSLGFASTRSIEYKKLLESEIDIPIILVDERLSTVEAERYLLDEDMSRIKRKGKIDAVAASVILNTYMRMKGNEQNEK